MKKFTNQRGSLNMELALIVVLLAVACIGALSSMGTNISTTFNRGGTVVQNAGN